MSRNMQDVNLMCGVWPRTLAERGGPVSRGRHRNHCHSLAQDVTARFERCRTSFTCCNIEDGRNTLIPAQFLIKLLYFSEVRKHPATWFPARPPPRRSARSSRAPVPPIGQLVNTARRDEEHPVNRENERKKEIISEKKAVKEGD